jgi:hypothetical protein
MRVIIRNVINGELKPLKDLGLENKKIEDVYTIINETLLYGTFDVKTGKPITDLQKAHLLHQHNVFFEDKGHDWKVINGEFKFYSRLGKSGTSHDIIVEYSE